MAAKKKGSVVLLLLLALAIYWFLLRAPSSAATLASDLATGQQPAIPTFGTDNIIDVADALATEKLTLPTSTTQQGAYLQ